MVQTIPYDKEIKIQIKIYDYPSDSYMAYIEGNEYKGIVVQANSIEDCIYELGISLKALEIFRKNTKV